MAKNVFASIQNDPIYLRGCEVYNNFMTGEIPLIYKVYRIMVGPDLARLFLIRNTHNRAINEERVRKMSNKILKGHGKFIHQGLGFSKTGVLLDGQHRLSAIVMSGVSMELQVTFGLEDDSQENIDGQLGRSLGVKMSLMRDNPGKTDPGAQIYNQLEILLTTKHGGRLRDPDDLAEFKAQFTDFDDSIDWLVKHYKPNSRFYKGAYIKGALVLAYPAAKGKVTEFAKLLAKGEGLYEGDPAFAARRYIDSIVGTEQKDKREASQRILRCIRAYIEGEKLYQVKTRAGDVRFFAEKNGVTLPKTFVD